MKKLLCSLLLVTVLGSPASPALADVKAGVDSWSAGEYDAAVRQWKALADKGDPDAQFNLAQAYKLGRGVPLDLIKAEDLYGRAAAQGHILAADNFGILLFQRGERERALPYIQAAAARGDARAQYILGIAHFNGDIIEKNWVRAYALVSLAQQAGLPQATNALTKMNEHIPLADRQNGVALARQIAADSEATRDRQLAAAELGNALPVLPSASPSRIASDLPPASAPMASPAAAGADFARNAPPPAAVKSPAPAAAKPVATKPSPATPVPAKIGAAKPAPPKAATGSWRIQLGVFSVSGNAEKLWSKLAKRPEIAGHSRQLVPAGKLTKLYVGGYATRAAATSACASLKASGQDCIVSD